MTENVKTEIEAGIMTLTLSRADKKNALSHAMYGALSDGLERAEADATIRVILFQGDGDSFTAGNDIADFGARSGGSPADYQHGEDDQTADCCRAGKRGRHRDNDAAPLRPGISE